MNVKEFKDFLKLFKDDDLIINVFQEYIKRFGTNTECEVALQSAFDKFKDIAWTDKCKRINLEQQLSVTQMYLKGEMYTDEETAKRMLGKQIKNIEEVLKEYE